jgi:IS30 family transposase
MKRYKHLSREERYIIKALRSSGKSITSISITMKRSKGTISMELRRNLESKIYMPCVAHELYKGRLHKEDGFKIEKDVPLKFYIIDAMKNKYWSPDAISGRLKSEQALSNISTESIYRYIYTSPPENHPFTYTCQAGA